MPAHPYLELAYLWSQIGIVGVVALGAIAAICQLRASNRQSHATFLLELDRRWEGPELVKARGIIRKTKVRIEDRLLARFPEGDEATLRENFKTVSAEALDQMREADFSSYECFMQVWGFMETMGHLHRDGYLSLDEVASLFGHAIVQMDDLSRDHIQERAIAETKKVGVTTNLYENATTLADKIRARASRSGARNTWKTSLAKAKNTLAQKIRWCG